MRENTPHMSYISYSNDRKQASPVEIILKKSFGNSHFKAAQQH